MAKAKTPAIFPADAASEPVENPQAGPPAFPDMKSLSRETVEPAEESAAGKLAVCVRTCLYRGVLYKPGTEKHFSGDIPPHFILSDG